MQYDTDALMHTHASIKQFCENTGEYPYTDPHSIHRLQNWFYCYMGWTIHPYEMRVDWDFVRPQFKVRQRCVRIVPGVRPCLASSVPMHFHSTGRCCWWRR